MSEFGEALEDKVRHHCSNNDDSLHISWRPLIRSCIKVIGIREIMRIRIGLLDFYIGHGGGSAVLNCFFGELAIHSTFGKDQIFCEKIVRFDIIFKENVWVPSRLPFSKEQRLGPVKTPSLLSLSRATCMNFGIEVPVVCSSNVWFVCIFHELVLFVNCIPVHPWCVYTCI